MRKAKAEAALRGMKLRELVQSGIEQVLAQPAPKPSARPTAFDLMQEGCGVVESGVGDLASNPKYLANFGRE